MQESISSRPPGSPRCVSSGWCVSQRRGQRWQQLWVHIARTEEERIRIGGDEVGEREGGRKGGRERERESKRESEREERERGRREGERGSLFFITTIFYLQFPGQSLPDSAVSGGQRKHQCLFWHVYRQPKYPLLIFIMSVCGGGGGLGTRLHLCTCMARNRNAVPN